jgi:hypothetical protein
MYDFYLGSRPKTLDEEIHYLISVKRLLPRWINSIPDSEFAAIATILHNLGNRAEKNGEKLYLIETGVGASSLALAFYSIKHHGTALTWDFNSKKGSEIRSACSETICTLFDTNINSAWKLIGYNSRSPYLGIGIISEWTDTVHFTMHDSEHVWDNVEGELDLVAPFLKDGSVVAVDDAYYDFLHTDTAYINITRKKLGLQPIEPIKDNTSKPHAIEAENFLKQRWQQVKSITGDYKTGCRNDVSIGYFSNELQVRSALGMEQVQQLENRFGAWEVTTRKPVAR